MTTQNARLNEAENHKGQLRILAMKMALETRKEDEEHSTTMQRATDIYEWFQGPPKGNIQVVQKMPGVA